MAGYNRPRCSQSGCSSAVVGRRLCRAHYQAAWKRGEFVNAPLPPRFRNPKVCPPEHKHGGSTTCYIQHQCRCDSCRAHHSDVDRNRNKLKAYGRFDTGLVDAEPVRAHMMLLAESGIGYKRAAMLAGIGTTAARNLIYGRQEPGPRYGEIPKRVKRETAEAVLAVLPIIDNVADGTNVSSRGVHRRVQALVARGWSQSKLSDKLGLNRGNFGVMMQQTQVNAGLHRRVAALYEELWDQEPPHEEWREKSSYSRALRYSRERRWLPPLAWDDIDTDPEPPVAEPDDADSVDEMAVDLAIAGDHIRLTPAERRAAVARLHASRYSDGLIAERLRVNERTVLRIRQELELEAFSFGELEKVSGR